MPHEPKRTKYENNPTCPECGYEDHEWWDYGSGFQHDGDQIEVECAGCAIPLRWTLHVEYSFDTETYDPEQEKAEHLANLEKQRARVQARKRLAGLFTPGTAVTVTKEGHRFGEQGVIANAEMHSQGYVQVQLEGQSYTSLFEPEELSIIE